MIQKMIQINKQINILIILKKNWLICNFQKNIDIKNNSNIITEKNINLSIKDTKLEKKEANIINITFKKKHKKLQTNIHIPKIQENKQETYIE